MTHGKNEAGTLLPKVFTFNPVNAPIRVQMINNEPWFVANDVCQALSISNSRDAVSRLDEDERGVSVVPTPSGSQEMNLVNESGLYSLIFQSRKPEAKVFRKWVTSEVLPSIRRTGRYEAPASINKRRTRGELMNAEILNLLWLIGESLKKGDQKEIALQLGVSQQAICNTLNGYSRSPRILMALYQRARSNREVFMLYHQPDIMAQKLIDGQSVEPGNHLPVVKITSKRGGALGNQNAKKKGGRP